ncbi:bZIP transcription factor RISBZ5 isoform X1 [Brachypodium distachyon]|uniref:BZIP domain-containing protein n=1 Tax=Brachypodium distachyon TaxID=15368 RepID=I1GVU4_BRADI|nr:bZIP transcription factor RISBZ5 isoform X1 [Brachypodium distachyon]KQK16970.1 hypothetical protein BRADI_1g31700v3 [Brachypodium distachyon]|eukprot:XP_010240308.1 bZIP transcription factor RISBZ5 isoform X1 [Brachypodium distachyon]
MKKCASELELEAFIRQHLAAERNRPSPGTDAGVFSSTHGGGLPVPGLCFGDSQKALELEGSDAGHQWWSDGVCAPHPAVSSTMGSQTAAVSASPRETTSGNQALESESESGSESLIDIEGGQCNRKSTDTMRIRRMVSNRESARRSRRRKHAQLTDLELQVEQLKSESASLFKQLTEASQHFTSAVTDNRILKSDVETLRVKVKMAEDMVARTAMSCNVGQLGSAPFLNSRKMCQALDMLTATGLDLPGNHALFKDPTPARQVQTSTVQSTASLESLDNRMSSEVTSCAGDMWP